MHHTTNVAIIGSNPIVFTKALRNEGLPKQNSSGTLPS